MCDPNMDMFATPSTTFELPLYVVEFANLLAKALSSPPSPTRPFNKLELDFLDIEVEHD